jgi:hypothetical protein
MQLPAIKKNKAIAFSVFVALLGGGWLYFYGLKAEKYRTEALEKGILLEYSREQTQYFRENGRYRPDLHSSVRYQNVKGVMVGFANEMPQISSYCGDCVFSDSSYKSGAYSRVHGDELVWTIDNSGQLKALPSQWPIPVRFIEMIS